MENKEKLLSLTTGSAALTDRELSVLAVAVTEMVKAGLDPFRTEYVVQLEHCLH